jgi:hypothetical protein
MRRALAILLLAGSMSACSFWRDFKEQIQEPPPYSFDQQERYKRAYPSESASGRPSGMTCVRSGAFSNCTQKYSDGTSRSFSCRSTGASADCRER